MTVIRAAITQAEWTGDEESMVVKHEGLAREAAAQARPSSASRSSSTVRTSGSSKTPSTTSTRSPSRAR